MLLDAATDVETGTAVALVQSRTAEEPVVRGLAGELVRTVVAIQAVTAATAGDPIGPLATEDLIGAADRP